jgi:hypothetical protein
MSKELSCMLITTIFMTSLKNTNHFMSSRNQRRLSTKEYESDSRETLLPEQALLEKIGNCTWIMISLV